MSKNVRLVILMGPPAVGKGTLASNAIDQMDFLSLSTGQVFREHIANKTDLGIMIKSAIERGELVPNDVVDKVVQSWLAENCCCGKKIMLDGYPRTLSQAVFLVDLLKKNCLTDGTIVYVLEAESTVIKNRMLGRLVCSNKNCGQIYSVSMDAPGYCVKCSEILIKRKDDTLEIVANRVRDYFEVKQSIIDYFVAHDLSVVSVDTSEKNKAEVFADFKISVYGN